MDVPQHSLHELPKVQRSQARMYSVPDVLGNALMSHAVMEFLEHSLGGDWLGGLAAGCSTEVTKDVVVGLSVEPHTILHLH